MKESVGSKDMATYILNIDQERPYFAELPYYLWGTVNYDSEGDCKRPTDRQWTWFELTHRETQETISISDNGSTWRITGDDLLAARAALFFCSRCGARCIECCPEENAGTWDHEAAMKRADRVAAEFASPELKPFDSHLFWGGWKWIGWFATEFTWVGRWIMVSVLKSDPRGVPLCIDWLKQGTLSEYQSAVLRYALNRLTGKSFNTDDEWVRWYEEGLAKRASKFEYPEPDFDQWLTDLKQEYGDSQQGASVE